MATDAEVLYGSSTPAPAVQTAPESAQEAPRGASAPSLGSEDGQSEEPAGEAAPKPVECGGFTFPAGAFVDEEILGTFSDMAEEVGIDAGNAQRLLDLHQTFMVKEADAREDAFQQVKTGWEADLRALPEFRDYDASVKLAHQGLEAFAGGDAATIKTLMEALNVTGLGSHPAVVRGFYKLGQLVRQGKAPGGGTVRAGPRSDAEVMYGGR